LIPPAYNLIEDNPIILFRKDPDSLLRLHIYGPTGEIWHWETLLFDKEDAYYWNVRDFAGVWFYVLSSWHLHYGFYCRWCNINLCNYRNNEEYTKLLAIIIRLPMIKLSNYKKIILCEAYRQIHFKTTAKIIVTQFYIISLLV